MEGYFDQLLLEPARHFVEKATDLFKKDRAVALAEFSNPEGGFVYGEHYVYVLDSSGVMLAHGANPEFVGQDFFNVMDIDGKPFIQEIIESAGKEETGYIEYKWADPLTRTQRPKTVFYTKSDGAIICSGVYGANPLFCTPEDVPVEDDGLDAPDAGIEAFKNMSAVEAVQEPIADDAKSMVEKAATFYNANDKGVALAEFSNVNGRFVNGSQYVYVLDTTGRMLAHGVHKDYVGKDFYRRADSDGKRFIQEIVDTANTRGSGWVEYKWFNPVTRKEELKTVFFQKANGVIICSGIYNSGA